MPKFFQIAITNTSPKMSQPTSRLYKFAIQGLNLAAIGAFNYWFSVQNINAANRTEAKPMPKKYKRPL